MLKPRRRIGRWVVAGILVTLVGWLGSEVYRAFTAVPGPSVNYLPQWTNAIEAFQPEGVGPGEGNAWESMKRAGRLLADVPGTLDPEPAAEGERKVPLDFAALMSPLPRGDYDGFSTYEQVIAKAEAGLPVAARLGVFDALAEAAARPRAVRDLSVQPRRLEEVMLPELGEARGLARLEAGRMYVAHRDGDEDGVARSFEEMLAIGRICAQQGTLIDTLVAHAIRAMAFDRVRTLVLERAPSWMTLERMLHAMDRQALPSAALAARVERLALLDAIQWRYTSRGRVVLSELRDENRLFGDASLMKAWPLSLIVKTGAINLGSIAYASKASVSGLAERYAAEIETFESPRYQRGASSVPNPAALGWRYTVLSGLVSSRAMMADSFDRAALEAAGTRVFLAIELFRARTGRCPATLAELGLPAEALVDPWHGVSFGYVVTDRETDELHRAYILYALGRDVQDNGGVCHKEGAHIAMGPHGVGYDYVFTLSPEFTQRLRDAAEAERAPKGGGD